MLMLRSLAAVFIFLTVLARSAHAAQTAPSESNDLPKNFYFGSKKDSGQIEKNGIDVKALTKNFAKDFRLVSAHFREDKNEMRFIYANDLGIEGLASGKTVYKDGTVFYKAVYNGIHDPAFEPSIIPDGNVNVRQVMLYNKEKYKQTGGWTYAVFGPDGLSLPGDPKQTIIACLACHEIVKQRNYVFSTQLMNISPWDKGPTESVAQYLKKTFSPGQIEKLFSYKTVPFSSLSSEIQRMIRVPSKNINLMNGAMMNTEFTGFVAEVGSSLVRQAHKTGIPSVALKPIDGTFIFGYAYADPETKDICEKGKKLYRHGGGRTSAKLYQRNGYTEVLSCEN
jgi:hypothetical protein